MPDTLLNAVRFSRGASIFACRLLFGACIAAGFVTPSLAQKADRWVTHKAKAEAALPLPKDGDAVTAMTLSCAAQRWTLAVAVSAQTPFDADAATLTVDQRSFALSVAAADGVVSMAVPRDALEPLKTALHAELEFSGEAVAPLSLSLRGSKLAITALQQSCSPRDMSAYDAVSFTASASELELARTLRHADIETFALATASQPQVTAAMVDFGEGRRILFTRLCGSAWYYGRSGCNVTGFTSDPAQGEIGSPPSWQVIYDSEGALLYSDPKAVTRGWPDLVTLPARGEGSGKIWRWTGVAYAVHAPLPEDDAPKAAPLAAQQAQD